MPILPVADYQHSRTEIDAALRRIRDRLTSDSPEYGVTAGANDATGSIDTLNVTDGNENIKVEVNPVLRGSVNEPALLSLRQSVQAEFGFAEITTLAFEDVYAGKLMAALDRQHPRDLFDVMILFENKGISDRLFRTWLAYLIGHKGSMADSLSPHRKDIGALFRDQFVMMTEREVTLKQLLEVRERLIAQFAQRSALRRKSFCCH